MKKTIILSIVLFATLSTLAQTQNTNDVRVYWNCALSLSTNQFQTWQYYWRRGTNGVSNPASIDESLRGATRELLNVHLAQLAEQRRVEESMKTNFIRLQAAWLEMTPAQQEAVLNAAGIIP